MMQFLILLLFLLPPLFANPEYIGRKVKVNGKTFIIVKKLGKGGAKRAYQARVVSEKCSSNCDIVINICLKSGPNACEKGPYGAPGSVPSTFYNHVRYETPMSDVVLFDDKGNEFTVTANFAEYHKTSLQNHADDFRLHPDLKIHETRARIRGLLAIAHQVSTAIDQYTKQGLAHQDVKPANIFIRGLGESEDFRPDLAVHSVVLGDGDLAAPLTDPSMLMRGTMSFAPKEKTSPTIFQHTPSSKQDMFSLGMSLVDLLMGRHYSDNRDKEIRQALDGNGPLKNPQVDYMTSHAKSREDAIALLKALRSQYQSQGASDPDLKEFDLLLSTVSGLTDNEPERLSSFKWSKMNSKDYKDKFSKIRKDSMNLILDQLKLPALNSLLNCLKVAFLHWLKHTETMPTSTSDHYINKIARVSNPRTHTKVA